MKIILPLLLLLSLSSCTIRQILQFINLTEEPVVLELETIKCEALRNSIMNPIMRNDPVKNSIVLLPGEENSISFWVGASGWQKSERRYTVGCLDEMTKLDESGNDISTRLRSRYKVKNMMKSLMIYKIKSVRP